MEPEATTEILSPEIISALISASGTIIAAIIAWLSAKSAAKREIRKLKTEWARQDKLSDDQKFTEMTSAVSRYIQTGWPRHQREALEKISTVQSTGRLSSDELQCLYEAVLSSDIDQCRTQLSVVIRLRQQIVDRK